MKSGEYLLIKDKGKDRIYADKQPKANPMPRLSNDAASSFPSTESSNPCATFVTKVAALTTLDAKFAITITLAMLMKK
jgi:hypothetical protein